MSDDKPDWNDAEQTIVSFSRISRAPVEEQPKPPAAGPSQDEDATILGGEYAPVEEFDDRTVVRSGVLPAREVERMAWLIITKTPSVRKGQLFALDKLRNDIGRGDEVAVFLNDPQVGRLHATVKYELSEGGKGQFVLYDLASTNGTFLNSQRLLSPTLLKDGDRITLGDTELAFKQL
jgi:hypothetical protein